MNARQPAPGRRSGHPARPPSRNPGCSPPPTRLTNCAATGFEQLHASHSPGKRSELEERQSALVMRDDEEDGAPPNRTTVDLAGGTAVVRLPRADQ
ncbi:DUF6191 domain-containing protein [Streptomyces bobili]|uniref:DUF6191 domain-containing protein n=1 Tax=Streptomyces bobili TaxID=67280 RepID=UPI003F53F1FE